MFCFNYLLGKTLTNVQSSHPDLFIKAPFLIIWFNCECRSGGEGGEKENSGVRAYRKNTVVTSKECKLKTRKPQPKPKFKRSELAA